MDFRFVAYDPQTGTKLYQLPRANSVNIGDTFGTRGTLELTYSAKAVNARDLPTFLEVQAEVTFDEGHNWAPAGPSLLRLSGEHEDTDQAGMRTLRFVGREWVLGKARVGNGDLELIDGKRPFYRASPGQILRTLILEAQDRGAADGIEIGNFTAAKDSSGKAWAKVATIYYGPGLPISSVLENLVEQGMCDYRMNGRTIELFDPETTMGRDLTAGNNPVRVHGAVTEAPVKYTLEDLANSALLMGDEGFALEVDNPTAPDDYGRLEVTIEQGGVSDNGTARLMVDEALHRGSREVREITRSQSAAGAAFLPFRDYRVGDYVQVRDGGSWEKYRVREIQLSRDGDEWTVHTVINDRLQELLLKLAKRTSGIVNGTTGSGGDGTRPAPAPQPGIEPAAPEGLVVDQQVYLDRQGVARGQITAGWGAVTESTKGQAVEIGGYELWWRENETMAVWRRASSVVDSTNVTHSPVVLSDADGNALEYQWRVRAIAEASARPGPWSDTVTLTMTQDTEPPNTPSMPTVTTDLRIVTVEIDGLDEFGEAMPIDYNHTRIYFAAAEDMAGAEQVGTLTQPGSWNSGSMAPDVPVWVAVSAVDHVGNESAMTPAQSVTPRKLVDDSSIRDELTGIDDKIQDAVDDLNEEIEKIITDGTGTTTYWMPTEPDETTTPPPKAGDLWFDTSEGGGKALSRHDGQGWVSASDERIQTIQDAQDALEADIDTVRTSVDGKSRITQSTSTPPAQYDGSVGDRWERMSSMGSGGSLISNWRWNGTVWVSTIISDAVLGNVDAAKIGTGYLDADRIEAGTVSSDKILVGGGGNLIAWNQVTSGITTEPHYKWGNSSNLDLALAPVDSDRGVPPHLVVTRHNVSSENYVLILMSSAGRKAPGVVGDRYTFSVILYSDTPDTTASIQLATYTSDGTSTSGYIAHIATGPVVSLSSEPLRLTVTGEAPEGTQFLAPLIRASGPADIGVVSPSLRPQVGATLIEDGAITTGKIETGAITSDSGIFGEVDAGILNAGEIAAARIGANTITSDKLLVGEFIELAPSLASYSGEWELYGPAQVINLSRGYDGKGIQFLEGGDPRAFGPRRDTKPGDVWRLDAFCENYSDGTGQGRIGAYFYDADGVYVTLTYADTGSGELSGTVKVPEGAAFVRLAVRLSGDASGGPISVRDIHGQRQAGATLIQDGAITTEKILANAITAGKIAALAIEADHISANAITADKIHAGAIDSMLITGARIRTAASGRRTELDVEGLKSYDSSGNTVLTTQTSDGSISMKGALRQTSKGITIEVGNNYQGGGPAIQWQDSSIYNYPPGVVYSEDTGEPGKMRTLIQGPGVTDGNSFLSLNERGDRFDLRAWKGTGSSRKDWRVQADLTSREMLIGGSQAGLPYVRLRDGAADVGEARMQYQHPNNGAYGGVILSHKELWLGAYDADKKMVSRLWGDADSTELTAGTRNLHLGGKDVFLSPTGDISLDAGAGIYIPGKLPPDSDPWLLGRNSGRVVEKSSSRRFKLLEESVETTVESFEDKLLTIDGKTWIDKPRAERLADYYTAVENGDDPGYGLDSCAGIYRIPGVIAEDLHDAGLGIFVRYDEQGRPASVNYDGIAPALIPIIRRLRDRVDALETKLGATA